MTKKIILYCLLSLSFPLALWSQSDEVREKNFNLKKTVALEGFDPVSYFDSNPRKGKEEIRFVYKRVTYQFSSQTNLNKFKANPGNFEPAYGGWCAYAMGKTGEKVKIDPETYKIKDGKLYLFYNFWGNNTLVDWNKSEPELKAKGDENWKKFVH